MRVSIARTDEGEGTFVTEQDTVQAPASNGSNGLGSLKLAQLKDLASQLGITGTSGCAKHSWLKSSPNTSAVAARNLLPMPPLPKKTNQQKLPNNPSRSQLRKLRALTSPSQSNPRRPRMRQQRLRNSRLTTNSPNRLTTSKVNSAVSSRGIVGVLAVVNNVTTRSNVRKSSRQSKLTTKRNSVTRRRVTV